MANYTGLFMKVPATHRDLARLEYPVRTIMEDMGGAFESEEIQRIGLAIHELCLHIITQNADKNGCITIVIEPLEDSCEIHISVPTSKHQEPLKQRSPFLVDTLPIEDLELWSAQCLMDEMTHETLAGRDSWWMVKYAV